MIVVMQMPQQSAVQTQFSRWLFFNEKNVPISNFIPSVISVVKVISSSGTREDIRVRLHFENEKITETIVPLSDLDSVNWFDIDHHCIVNSEYRQSRKYIADTIRSAIGTAPLEQRYSLDRTGIYRIEDTIVFAAGDRIITQSNVSEADSVFELGQLPFRLDIDENIDLNTAIEGMVQLVSLSPEIGHILIAHVISGIIRAAFKEAGMTPCAVLVIVGKSGMLKSHYIPHLVQLYNRGDGIGPVTRFNSTKRFIEDALYEYSECTAIIDDLHTAESSAIKRQNEDTAEEIIRRISEDCFRLAKNEKNFNPEKHDGLIYYGCLCLRGKRLEGKLRNVCSGFSLADCINGLLTKDALKVVGNKNTVQISGTGGKRFYAIKLDKLK